MVYPRKHLYLTAHWLVAGQTDEEGQIGLRVDYDGDGTQGQFDTDIAPAFSAFWSDATSYISSGFSLYMLKAAPIGVDGKYPPDAAPLIHTYSTAVPGGGSATNRFPLQTAHVVSLTTAKLRGRAHRGRVYLPPLSVTLNTQNSWGTSEVGQRNANFRTLLLAINSSYGQFGGGGTKKVSVFSKVSGGYVEEVTGLAGGTRPDVQRRRARQQAETYSTLAL